MNSISVDLGDVFLIETPPRGMHLYFVIAHVSSDLHLLVNATTLDEKSEKACILRPGYGVPDFITHESVITYRRCREISSSGINRLIYQGICVEKGCCSDDILIQIQQGGLKSKLLPNKYKTILRTCLDTL
jgi:hypothetical protein